MLKDHQLRRWKPPTATHSHPQPPTATHGLGAGFDLNNFHNPGGLSQVLSLEVSIEADVEPPTSQIPAL